MKTSNNNSNLIFIMVLVVMITILHYYTSIHQTGLHDFYRKLYYIPVILAAFRFKLRGGLITPIAITILYSPYLIFHSKSFNIQVINQILEVLLFIVVGVITGILVELQDSQRRLLERQVVQLSTLENYTKNILESILNGVVALNDKFEVTTFNTEAKRLMGIQSEPIHIPFRHPIFESPAVVSILKKVSASNRPALRHETVTPTGTPVRIYVYPMRNIPNQSSGLVVAMEDIQEVRKLEDQVRRSDRLTAIGELASGVAHEIRNPLGIIKTISQTIKDEAMPKDVEEGLDIINEEINRANRVIERLLDFARPKEVEKKPENMKKVLEDVVSLTSKYAKQNKVDLIFSSPGENYMVYGNIDVLKQAFVNLIFNGVQAMPDGGLFKIDLLSKNEQIFIIFEDQGVGIPPENLKRIFNPFFTTKPQGTGLGLPITHRIIEEHNGTIAIESSVNEGTKITITLPAIKEEPHEKEDTGS